MFSYIWDIFTLKFVEHAFVDIVSGEDVFIFEDSKGKQWLKNSRFSIFKVERCSEDDE